MKRLMIILSAVFALGISGAFLRAGQLIYSYDGQTQLVSFDLFTVGLLAPILLAVIAVLLFLRGDRDREPEALPAAWFALEGLAAAVLAVYSVIGFVGFLQSEKLSSLAFSLLTAFAAFGFLIGLISVKRRTLSKTMGFYYIIGIFWGCFTLILDFWGHAGNPVWMSYVFGMLSLMTLTMSMNYMTGFFFGKKRKKQALFASLLGIVFSVTAFGGPLIYTLLGNSDVKAGHISYEQAALYVFEILHMAAIAIAVQSNIFEAIPGEESGELKQDEDSEESLAAALETGLNEAVIPGDSDTAGHVEEYPEYPEQ